MAGAFVTGDVPYVEPSGSLGTHTLVSDQIDLNNERTDSFVELFTAAIENVTSVAAYSPDYEDLVKEIKPLAIPAFPDRPTIDTELNTNWPSMDIANPVHLAVNIDTDFVEPPVPDSLNPYFDYIPGEYYSKIWEPLSVALLSDLVSGGTGLTESVYSGIVDRHDEARRRTDDAARVALGRRFGGPGALMPSGALLAATHELEEDIRRGKKDSLNEILTKDFDLADTNTRFTKGLLQTVEAMLRADHDSKESRLFGIASTSKELTIRIYEENAKIYNYHWEGIKIKMEAAKIEADVIIAANKSEDENFKSKAMVLETRVNAIVSQNKGITDAAMAESNIYTSGIQGVAIEINALISEIQVQKDLYLADLQAVLGKEGLNLQAYTSANDLNAEKLVSLAQMLSQAVASALGMTNTGMSIGATNSSSSRHGYTLNNSLSESHSTSEE